jgi:hypothetical protein
MVAAPSTNAAARTQPEGHCSALFCSGLCSPAEPRLRPGRRGTPGPTSASESPSGPAVRSNSPRDRSTRTSGAGRFGRVSGTLHANDNAASSCRRGYGIEIENGLCSGQIEFLEAVTFATCVPGPVIVKVFAEQIEAWRNAKVDHHHTGGLRQVALDDRNSSGDCRPAPTEFVRRSRQLKEARRRHLLSRARSTGRPPDTSSCPGRRSGPQRCWSIRNRLP